MKTKTAGTPAKRILVALVMLTLVATGMPNHEASAGQPETNKKDKHMLAEKQIYQTEAAIPAIDAKAPAEFETATFGLG
jgi:hypothetical protein